MATLELRNISEATEESHDDSSRQCSSRVAFSLKAFSEMADTRSSSIIPQDLYKNPPSVVELVNGAPQTSDDTVIKRMTMGKMAKTAAFEANQATTSTTPRRPSDRYYMCPSNTFIASNGDVYEIEPFMLPPPTEIAELFKELKNRRDRSDSNMSDGIITRPSGKLKIADSLTEKHRRSPLVTRSLLRNTSFDSTPPKSGNQTSQANAILSLRNAMPINIESRSVRELSAELNSSVTAIIEEDDDEGVAHSRVRAHSHSRSGSEVEEVSDISQLRKRYQRNDVAAPVEKPESSIGAYPSFLHTDQPKNSKDGMFNWNNFSLQKYLMTEMLGIGEAGHLQPTAVGNMQNFLTVPSKVEMFIVFGFFICLDAFLYVMTFLPIRVAYSLYLLFCESLGILTSFAQIDGSGTGTGTEMKGSSEGRRRGMALRGHFHRSHLYDLMRGAFMLLSCYVLMQLNMSRVYHYIRGQTLIKLYVLTAMLEIFDKLLCSFGQDAFDSLYCITRMRPEPRRILFEFLITAVYTTIHSGLYFMLIANYTVAINSADQALVTVLVLNNFAEIKSFVFKKFDKQNLFQLSCSDITERFQLAVADWIKHAFISKFNHINANVYDDFARVLRKDILNCHKDKMIQDQTYAITKRVGLAQIPLGCVSIRYLLLAFASPGFQTYFAAQSKRYLVLLFFFWFGILVLCKIVIGLGLIGYSGIIHNHELRLKAEQEERNQNGSSRFERKMSMSQLSNIERYTVYKGRVVG